MACFKLAALSAVATALTSVAVPAAAAAAVAPCVADDSSCVQEVDVVGLFQDDVLVTKMDEFGLLQVTGAHSGIGVQRRQSPGDDAADEFDFLQDGLGVQKRESSADTDDAAAETPTDAQPAVEDVTDAASPVADLDAAAQPAAQPAVQPATQPAAQPTAGGAVATVFSTLAKAFSQDHLVSPGGTFSPRAGSVFASRLALFASLLVLAVAALAAAAVRLGPRCRARMGKGKGTKFGAEGEPAKEHHALLADENSQDAPPMGMMQGPQGTPKRGYGANSRL